MRRGLVQSGCPSCGQVVVPASSVVCGTSQSDSAALAQFECPRCGRPLLRPLEITEVSTLLLFGARTSTSAMPFELLESHIGPPVSWDELLEFHLALTQTCCPADELTQGRAA